MLMIHALLIVRLFMYAIISFSIIDYMVPRKSKILSFFGCTLVLYILNILILFVEDIILHSDSPNSQENMSVPQVTMLVLFFIVYFSALHISFKDSFLKKVFVTLLILVIGIINEAIMAFISYHLLDSNSLNKVEGIFSPLEPYQIISSILILTTSLIIYTTVFKILIRNNNTWENQKKFVILIFLSLQLFYGIFLLNAIYILKQLSSMLQTVFIAIPVVSIILFIYSLYSKNMNYKLNQKSEYTELLIASQSKHINEILEQHSQIMRIKHDLSTHVRVISDLAETKKYDELIKYAQEFKEDFTLKPLHFCSRSAVNTILSYIYNTAKEKDIDVQIFFDDKGAEYISDIDLCTVVSNLLQNAIEACERINNTDTKRFIKLAAGLKAECFIIKQINSGLQPNEGLKTSKNDTKNHGVGVYIITDMVKKYNGSTKFEFSDGVFESTVILSN
ncbi:MAG: GHKL domain-containing protein [Oscillospiraceae bacterium]|nr:GHKL domain-containing protein [Oscillospiraceae bacterium]